MSRFRSSFFIGDSEFKICSTCEETKSVLDYYQSNQRAGARTQTNGFIQSRCKSCQAKDRDFYKKRNQKIISEKKLEIGCVDCGYKEHACALDFHHVNRETKDFTLASNKASGTTIKRILEEISRCIVLCSNCHRVRHHVKEKDLWI